MIDKKLLGFLPSASVRAFASGILLALAIATQGLALLFTARALPQRSMADIAHAPAVGAIPLWVVLLVLGVCFLIFEISGRALQHSAQSTFTAHLQRRLLACLDQLPDNEGSMGQTRAHAMTQSTQSASAYIAAYIPTFVMVVMDVLLSLLIVAPFAPAAGITAVIGMVVSIPLLAMVRIKSEPEHMRRIGVYASLAGEYEESFAGLGTLKAYNADEAKQRKLDADAEDFRSITMTVLGQQLTSIITSDTLSHLTLGAVLVSLLIGIGSGSVGVPVAVAALVTVVLLLKPQREMVYLSHAAAVAIRSFSGLEGLFPPAFSARADEHSEPTAVARGGNDSSTAPQRVADEATHPRVSVGELGVDYGEHATGEQIVALEKVSADFTGPGLYGIVGPSGSGKSTLAAVIAGDRPATSGDVRIDGTPIEDIPHDELRRIVMSVKGSDGLFAGTIRENLDPAGRGLDEQRERAALESVGLWQTVQSHGGLDAVINPESDNFSSGQRQRFVIARALLADAPVYVFDEVTSAIDQTYDSTIARAIAELSRRRLVIVISHRLANVKDAIRILVLDQAHVIESGSHHELLDAHGTYAALCREQSDLEGAQR